MKVLLYSHFFYPSIGGIESISASLADQLLKNDHLCKIITKSYAEELDDFSYEIYRNPSSNKIRSLIRWADIVVFNGASLGLQPWVLLYRKPFVWIHQGYQISCIDGLGWVDGEFAPITPLKSIMFHFKRKGFLHALKGGVKVYTKLLFAKYLVTANITCTNWVFKRLPKIRKKIAIHSPYPLKKFEKASSLQVNTYDFLFVGRIVSEKGLPTLILAFNKLLKEVNPNLTMLVIGDGDRRALVEEMIVENNIKDNVKLVGKKTGQELTDLIHSCKIAVVPSAWEEPMGGVALELLSAGRNIIVSKNGGMTECVGNGGVTFTNENVAELADTMYTLWCDKAMQEKQKEFAKKQLEAFQPEVRVLEHIQLFKQLIKK